MEKKLKKGSRIWQFSLLNATAHRNPYIIFPTEEGGYKAVTIIPIFPSFSYIRKFQIKLSLSTINPYTHNPTY